MRKFILTSSKFSGQVVFGYNDLGWLTLINNEADFNNDQFKWLFDQSRFPVTIEMLQILSKLITGKLEEVPPDISFNAFWDIYGRKINRKRAESLYNKMSEAQRLKCVLSIKPYFAYLNRVKWRNIADPDTYLRQEMFENNWNSLSS